MPTYQTILTHPGSAHKDDFLACCVLLATNPAPIERRDPTPEELANPEVCIVDIGHEHDPAKSNFDHHQFPRDHTPTCSLSLVLQHLGLYEDAKQFCDWLEPAEWFDCRGAKGTAEWLGVERDIIGKLSPPIDISMLRRFALHSRLEQGNLIWEFMKLIGEDIVEYLRTLHDRMDFIRQHSEYWKLNTQEGEAFFLFMPRTENLPEEPSFGIGRYIEQDGMAEQVIGMIYPDRRGTGYGLTRYNDSPILDFTQIEAEPDVHFAHKAGFVAKTSATDHDRLKALASKALVDKGV